MASKWFEGLGEQAQGFLIASLLYRSNERESAFAFLDTGDRELLQSRAVSILEFERTQRVRLLVAQLRRLLLTSSHPWIFAVDPTWIVALLQKESNLIQRAALKSLPKSLARAIAPSLGFTSQDMEPPLEMSPGLLTAIRKSIEHQLTPMRAVSFERVLAASLLLVLTKSELEVVITEAGKMTALSEDGLKVLGEFLATEPILLRTEIAQRLDFSSGQKMLDFARNSTLSDSELRKGRTDFFLLLIELAKNRKIDERFSMCIEAR